MKFGFLCITNIFMPLGIRTSPTVLHMRRRYTERCTRGEEEILDDFLQTQILGNISQSCEFREVAPWPQCQGGGADLELQGRGRGADLVPGGKGRGAGVRGAGRTTKGAEVGVGVARRTGEAGAGAGGAGGEQRG